MQKVFAAGMIKECNIPVGNVDRVFPRLADLLEIHLHFLHTLLDRQRTRPDRSVDVIGDVLYAQVRASEQQRELVIGTLKCGIEF